MWIGVAFALMAVGVNANREHSAGLTRCFIPSVPSIFCPSSGAVCSSTPRTLAGGRRLQLDATKWYGDTPYGDAPSSAELGFESSYLDKTGNPRGFCNWVVPVSRILHLGSFQLHSCFKDMQPSESAPM